MDVIVCIKNVPDTEAELILQNNQIDDSHLNYILNPFDEYAVEESVRIVEKFGGSVTVLSLGDEKTKNIIQKALAVGCQRAILIKAGKVYEPLVTAKALADTIRQLNFDILFFGKQAIDSDHSQTGQIVAALLGIPCLGNVVKLEVVGKQVTATRETEHGLEVVSANLPAVITAHKGLNEPRYPSLRNILAARKIQIEERTVQLTEEGMHIQGMELRPRRKGGRIIGSGAEAVPELVRLLRQEAKVL